MSSTFNFKASAVRTIESPSQKGVTTYFVYLNFRDLLPTYRWKSIRDNLK